MIVNAVMSLLFAAQVMSLTIAIATFGSLFLCFEQSLSWQIEPALNIGLPLAVAVTCQVFIGIMIFNDAKKRVWSDAIKCEIWASLGRSKFYSYNCALFSSPLLSITYFVMIMNSDININWLRERQRTSIFFRIITHRRIMDLFSHVVMAAPYVFIGGLLLFALGGAFNSNWLFFLSLRICGGMIILLPPIGVLFHFLVLTHFLSHEWVDHSYELFYSEYPVGRWPKHDWLDVRRYYRNVMRNE